MYGFKTFYKNDNSVSFQWFPKDKKEIYYGKTRMVYLSLSIKEKYGHYFKNE